MTQKKTSESSWYRCSVFLLLLMDKVTYRNLLVLKEKKRREGNSMCEQLPATLANAMGGACKPPKKYDQKLLQSLFQARLITIFFVWCRIIVN